MPAPVAQGIQKKFVIVKQSGLGVPGSAGGQIVRRVTSVFQGNRDTYDNPEIVSHQQSTGVTYGLKKVAGKYSGILSPLTYQLMFSSILRKLFVATTPLVIGTDCVSAVASPQIVDGSSGLLAGGLKVGDIGRFTGFTTTAVGNNAKNFLITVLTAGNMTGVFLDGSAMVAKTETGSVTFTVVGKKTMAPLTGHTNDYYTCEDWYSDVPQSDLFTDVQWAKCDIKLPASGNATVDFDAVGLARTIGTVQVLTTPTAETLTHVLTAVNGAVYVNGVVAANITSADLSIDATVTPGQAILGQNTSSDIQRGRIKLTGTFAALLSDSVYTALYNAETPISLILVVADQESDPVTNFVTFTIGRVKITGDAPDDGEKQIMRTYPFTAEINSAGGAALAWDQTILTIQDSAAV
jgi:hypothetical protein